jgi:trigger factor
MRRNSTWSIPEDYGKETLAGKTVRFQTVLKGLRRKELPDLNDDFAQDLGDFRTLDELKEALKKSIYAQREAEAQREAKDKLVDKLVDANEFPVPEAFVERQIENRVSAAPAIAGAAGRRYQIVQPGLEQDQRSAARCRQAGSEGIFDSQQGGAARDAIGVTNDEVDREVERIARESREPLVTVRKRLTKTARWTASPPTFRPRRRSTSCLKTPRRLWSRSNLLLSYLW